VVFNNSKGDEITFANQEAFELLSIDKSEDMTFREKV
jgi:hypothetical protein